MYPFSITTFSLTQEITLPLRELSNSLTQELDSVIQYNGECSAVVHRLLNHYFQVDATNFILNPLVSISPMVQKKLLNAISRLKKHEPIQYVIGEAYFAGKIFKVTPDVLIPRVETEEWVNFLINKVSLPTSILDIGTGSGCIAITLKRAFPQALVTAIDVSKEALKVARYNAVQLDAEVDFIEMNMLAEQLPTHHWPLIVSNPPYIRIQERHLMQRNVIDYEPHLALFVDDPDPLLFHRRIVHFAMHHLNLNGLLCLEINEALGKKVVDLLQYSNFRQVSLHKDIHGKERWVMATL
ncbi:peptide chain release factor N(5)-glutamine methyltransferase [Cardinium endosymbiont of Tipula unca]|uniref:peptide chain release factor N(5)-glutamine methyltransferase n=1 Tax=Cardinium endosymbiont of Tipula unca TaxID=3066216 RepID=UPI0030D18123